MVSGSDLFIFFSPIEKISRFIDISRERVNFDVMDADEAPRARPQDLLLQVTRQDIDPLSVAELEARIAMLKTEIERTEAKIKFAVNHRASADALFKS